MKKTVEGMPLADFLELCRSVKDYFHFLISSGFLLVSEKYPQTNSFKDGFSFKYVKERVSVQVEYYDMEYDILFTRGNQCISYLFVDRLMFNNHSGFQGNMFPRYKLLNAVSRTATDMEQNYQTILDGNESVWKNLIELFNTENGI